MAGLDYNAPGNAEHRFKYNGGVERTVDFGLSWDESGARNYDPQLGRFLAVDPLADQENQEGLTPYHFVSNNPVGANDPNGTCEGCRNFVESTVDFFSGVANAVVSNMTTNGITGQSLWARGQGGTSAYQAGQTMGDAVSVVAGVGEVVIGTVLGTGGVAVSSTGAGVIVGAPAAAAGAAVATHGTLTAANGIKNLVGPKPQTGGDQNGRVYAKRNQREQSSGSNLDDAKNQAESIEKAKANAQKNKPEGEKKQNKINSMKKSEQALDNELKRIKSKDDVPPKD
jgi:RHS repeat-associated protein